MTEQENIDPFFAGGHQARAVMNEEKAIEILADIIQPDNSLAWLNPYIAWSPGDEDITLDGRDFLIEEIEAIAWWMRNKSK